MLRREGSSDGRGPLTADGERVRVPGMETGVTDDWGIICGMQANAEGAVPEEGAGTDWKEP